MTTYTLKYFHLTAKAETIRMLFKLAGVEFEDKRISADDFFAQEKKDAPFGQLPVLVINDGSGKTELCQTKAIARYLSSIFGFYGNTVLDRAKVDMVYDCLADVRPFMEKIAWAPEDKVEEMRKDFESNKAPTMFAKLEKMVEGDGHFIKDQQLTMADIEMFNLEQFSRRAAKLNLQSILDKHPKIKDVIKNVENNDKIAQWLKTRPEGKF